MSVPRIDGGARTGVLFEVRMSTSRDDAYQAGRSGDGIPTHNQWTDEYERGRRERHAANSSWGGAQGAVGGQALAYLVMFGFGAAAAALAAPGALIGAPVLRLLHRRWPELGVGSAWPAYK